MQCLFCRGDGPFSTAEHIVPESLGNDCDILRGIVCDVCQNYLSHSVEKPALDSTPIGFWRTYLGVLTKRKNLPSFSSKPPKAGRLPSRHPVTDDFDLTAEEDGTASILFDSSAPRPGGVGEGDTARIVLSPWHLSIMGRLLGKMGLEYLALARLSDAMHPALDPIRQYVRRGSVSAIWPIYWGQLGRLADLRAERRILSANEREIETECYRYALGEWKRGGYVFAFGMGTEVYVIDLKSSAPDDGMTTAVSGCRLECIYYESGSF